MTYAVVKVVGPKGQAEVNLLVDTGSLLTWISRHTLEAVGVLPTRARQVRTIDGSELIREAGEALIEVLGEEGTNIVVFGEPGDAQVLGVVSLEGLGLEIDPTTKELKKTRVFAAYAAQ